MNLNNLNSDLVSGKRSYEERTQEIFLEVVIGLKIHSLNVD